MNLVGLLGARSRALPARKPRAILHGASTGERIKQVKALPPRERNELLRAVLALEERGGGASCEERQARKMAGCRGVSQANLWSPSTAEPCTAGARGRGILSWMP